MKRTIKASDMYIDASIKSRVRKILKLADQLFDLLESTSEEVFEEYDLQPLYDELNDTIYDMAHKLRSTDPLYDSEYRDFT